MTAVELLDKLSEFAERVRGMLWADGWHDLDEITDRLEEELAELDRMRCRLPEEHEEIADGGCYDGEVHPVDDEDYAAAMWVREHGGLNAVRGRLGERKLLVDRCRSYEDALDMMADSLGVERSSDKIVQSRRMRKAAKNLELRLMPDGMEWLVEAWPRFEDGEPVRFLDGFERYGDENSVGIVTMYPDGSFALNCRAYSKGERVNRPAPEVLDADGVEIRVGDTVYTLQDPRPYTVEAVGDTVAIRAHEGCVLVYRAPWALTHERPDSWERLDEDAGKEACEYFAHMPCGCETSEMLDETVEKCNAAKARDLVRRAKKLAGVSDDADE